MDIRILQYFLAVAREQTISGAAEALHMTQPPLSKQLKELEEELGKQLFVRGKRQITLTREGMLLRKRAEEIVSLMEKTKAEVSASDAAIGGDIYIGGGETEGMRHLAKTIFKIQRQYPHIHFHFFSGDGYDVTERLDRGLIDFGTLIEPIDLSKYDSIRLPRPDIWGLLLRNQPVRGKPPVLPALFPENGVLDVSGLEKVPGVLPGSGGFSSRASKCLFGGISNIRKRVRKERPGII